VDRSLAALAEHFERAGRGRRAASPLPLLAAARDAVLAREIDDVFTRTAESLYGIETTLRQHPVFFGLDVSAQPNPSIAPAIA
jgi:hypothetical protein